jgi:hypothetical protein
MLKKYVRMQYVPGPRFLHADSPDGPWEQVAADDVDAAFDVVLKEDREAARK